MEREYWCARKTELDWEGLCSHGGLTFGQITRAGCMLGSCIASYCAAAAQMDRHNNEGQLFRGDMLTAAGIYICFVERNQRVPKSNSFQNHLFSVRTTLVHLEDFETDQLSKTH